MNAFNFQRMRLGFRLGGAFGAMALLLLISVAFGVSRRGSLNASVESMGEQARAGLLASKLATQAHETVSTLGRAVLTDSVDEVQFSLKEANRLRTDSGSTKEALGRLLADDGTRAALKALDAAEQT